MKILILNSGSSSEKSSLFDIESSGSTDPVAPLWVGKVEWDGHQETLTIRNCKGKNIRSKTEARVGNRGPRIQKMLQYLWNGPAAVIAAPSKIAVIGHRVVHGGRDFTEPAVITATVKQAISDVSAIAPLHNEGALQGIEVMEKLLPSTCQIAVFDTGFHRTLPMCARVYAGPYEWYERGIQRYGFHGINHQYCAERTARLLRRDISSLRMVTCHLGNGCSLAAIDSGQCVDTTMGFTPLEGLTMGTRCGSIDPGILTYLMRTDHVDANHLDNILNLQSGMLGISGVSSDMREVLRLMAKGMERAKLAFEVFIHRLQAGIGAMAVSLGGLDALVFTGGIGENPPEVHRAACKNLSFLGIKIEAEGSASVKTDRKISSKTSTVRVLVIGAREDWAIARVCARAIADPPSACTTE